MRWGESRNLKLLRGFLIGFPSLFLIGFFGVLDDLDRSHGGPGLPPGWGLAVLVLILALTWLPAVPGPEVLRLPWRGGSRQAWGWRIFRAMLVLVSVLLVVGVSWGIVADLTYRDLGIGSQDYWVGRLTFATLYAIASLLFTLGPDEAMVGDLHPWASAETRALKRFLASLAVGWAVLAVPLVVTVFGLGGTWDDALRVVPIGMILGSFLGLTVYASSGLVIDKSHTSVR